MFKDKKQAFRCAKQSAAAKEFAIFKSRRQLKAAKSEKTPYEPGKLGLSAVSEAIKAEYGRIITRRERKRLAKAKGTPFQAFTARG
ncbi:hypothetical protein [Paenibacillus sp. GCM10027626]|uniref:hypothetical protein n=1 Tax=Paenibacillus sp. GCM10027626 TaxID=3273411 RepID=UPI0036265338